MKRLLLVLMGLMLAGTVSAKVLVVTQKVDANATGDGATIGVSFEQGKMQQRMIDACVDVFNATGMTYDLIPASMSRTRWLREGKSVTGWTSFLSDSVLTQYDAVIVLNATGKLASLTNTRPWSPSSGSCYPCSLTVRGNYPTVPMLWLFGANNGYSTGTAAAFTTPGTGAIVCSTGTAFGGGGTSAYPVLQFPATNTSRGWFSVANKFGGGAGYIRAATAPAGGLRPLLLTKMYPSEALVADGVIRSVAWADSFWTGAGADTFTVWERQLTGYGPAASPTNVRLVFADVMGASPCTDSTNITNGGTGFMPCEFDEPTLLFALAYFDSLTHGKVWEGTTSKLPIKGAVTIDGAFTRSVPYVAGGTNPADSAAVKACADSINWLGVPVTIGVNVDSLASYPYEVAWWKKITSARFSPQSWVGMGRYLPNPAYPIPGPDTTSYASLPWAATAPVDVFGRNRNRAFYGDSATPHTVAGSDSSIYQGLLAMNALQDTYFPGRRSKFLMAALDDYTPKNLTSKPGWRDSLVWIAKKAGYTALRTDVQYGDADPARIKVAFELLRGGLTRQQSLRDGIGGGEPLRVLGHTGYNTAGSQQQVVTLSMADSIAPGSFGSADTPTPPMATMSMARFYHGLFHEQFTDVDYFQQGYGFASLAVGGQVYVGVYKPREDHLSPMRRASILKLHVSDFGGGVVGTATPTRPGWWSLKSVANSFAGINAAAGRTVLQLSYPEDIQP